MSAPAGEQPPRTSPVQPKGSSQDRGIATGDPGGGLSSTEARSRLQTVGPNAMPDTSMHPLRMALEKFWAPVPWMLEAAVLLELVLGKYIEAAIIAALLVFNAALGLFQESRAQATLAALKSRLALNASVRRDGAWKTIPAADLVPGDVVKLSLGAVVAADVHLTGGNVLLDQSMLTGESVPVEAGAGMQTYAGALVRRGEALAEVTATGTRTRFGRTAELVRTAHVVSSQQKAVLRVVRNLAAFNGGVIVLLVACAWYLQMPLDAIVPLVLTAILASIPVALPATFTLAAALGAAALARRGVLPTRLSAVDEAATMDVLCSDKTGTLTRNALTVTTIHAMPGFDDAHVLALASLASSDGGQDPVDGAVRTAAAANPVSDAPKMVRFVPFDPATKMSEAMVTDQAGAMQRVVKGAFTTVIALASRVTGRDRRVERSRGEGVPRAGGRGRSARCDEAGGVDRAERPAAHRLGGAHQRAARTGRAHRHGHRRCPDDSRDRGGCGRAEGRRLPAGSHSRQRQPGTVRGLSPASCRRTSSGSSRRSRRAARPSGCAATAPTMRPRCARRRSGSRSPRRPTSPSRRLAWC